MPRITIPKPKSPLSNSVLLRYATTSPQTERRELRIAELNLAHALEIRHLDALLRATKQKLFASGIRRD